MDSKADYWLNMCEDDLITAKVLLNAGQLLWLASFAI